jgi:hypothetical protein
LVRPFEGRTRGGRLTREGEAFLTGICADYLVDRLELAGVKVVRLAVSSQMFTMGAPQLCLRQIIVYVSFERWVPMPQMPPIGEFATAR